MGCRCALEWLTKFYELSLSKRLNRYSAESSSALPNALFMVVMAGVAWWLYKSAVTPLNAYWPLADYWEYAAVVSEWLQNFSAPANPHVDSPVLSPSFTPYFALLTLLGGALGLDAVQSLAVGSVLNFVLIAAGLKLFAQAYFRNQWAPVVSLVVVFFCWGIGWNQHNLYQLGSFLNTGSYPSAFVFGLSLIAFRLTLQLLGPDALEGLWACLLIVVVALMFLCDPVTSVFGISGCLLLALTEPTGSQRKQLLALGMLVIGLGVAELWPFFSPWKDLLGLYDGSAGWATFEFSPAQRLSSGEWLSVLYQPQVIVATLGFALLGVPLVALLIWRREQSFIAYGALLALLPYALNLLVEIPQAERFLLFSATYLQLAVVWGWLELIDSCNEVPRAAMAGPALIASLVAGAGVISLNVWMAAVEFGGQRLSPRPVSLIDVRPLPQNMSVKELYTELLAPLGDKAVVLSTADDGAPVPVIKGKVVSVRYDNPLLADQVERYQDTGNFFYSDMDELDRIAIVQRYNVSHVLLNRAVQNVAERAEPWVANYGRLVAQRGDFRMYELSPVLQDIQLPARQAEADAPVAEAKPAAVKPAQARVSAEPERPARQPAVTAEEPDEQETQRSFGAPIAAPVLDPSRHGG